MKATFLKRLVASIYELLILIALWMLCTWAYLSLIGPADAGMHRLGLQLLIWLATGAYFIWCWIRSGQTPATQAWKLQLVSDGGHLLTLKQAVLRYLLASTLILFFGVGLIWAFFDKEQLGLHDRLMGTRWLLKT